MPKAGGSVDDAIHRILAKHAHRICGISFVRQVDQKRAQALILKRAGEEVKNFKKNRVVKIVRHQTDQFCPPGRQA
uniref:hypothetical protein n=1 Tax=uncultured Rhizobium sp. TaxID=155567 RepID=UPI002613334D|nr:hypothetical protein [uncultured Rhizobium sp.]